MKSTFLVGVFMMGSMWKFGGWF